MPKKLDTVLSEVLLEKGLITKKELEPIFQEANASHASLQQCLIKRKLFLEKDILNILAEKLKVNCVNIKDTSINRQVLDRIPLKVASYYEFMPLDIKDKLLTIAVSSPLDIKKQDEIRTALGYDIEMVLSCSEDILECLKKYYGIAADTVEKISSHLPGQPASSSESTAAKIEDIEKLAGDASVIKLVNQIILDAYKKRATDIHIEPYRAGLNLRYRIDGMLYDANVPEDMKSFLNAIISRIKIMSNLNIVEHRLPQDGRAVVKVQEQVLDLRISTMPTPYGESVVIRILPNQMLFSLEKLGLASKDLQALENLIRKPHGIIFVTGPTGSGKTTTLYACLTRINTKERKIITIEDPIEYEISGITQIQVMPSIGLDFARGLRSILRHDPDIIMVGEVRDRETADTAIRVALTGHLIFSSVHTNDAASGIARLIDIGVEPYLVASSVEAFIAQRLVRLICQECIYEDKSAPTELKEMIAKDLGLKYAKEVRIYRGKGCSACNSTGFFGRSAIYEMLLLDDTIKDLVLKKTPSDNIRKAAISKGMRTLRQDGWHKVIKGVTTPEEIIRVTSVDEEQADADKTPVLFSASASPAAQQVPFMDRRAYARLNSKVNLSYKVVKSQGELIARGYEPERLSKTKNISAGGLLFVSDESLPMGSILEMAIEAPGNAGPIKCLARVVRVEEIEKGIDYDIGVCFLDISSAERARLDRYVETRLKK